MTWRTHSCVPRRYSYRRLALLGGTRLLCLLIFAPAAHAQAPVPAAAIAHGETLYAARCAPCHGKDAHGGEGPDLYRSRIVVAAPETALLAAIQKGIPGSEMPPSGLADAPAKELAAYLYSLTRPGSGPPVPGDAAAGRQIFEREGCGRCHMVDGRGGALGPDLSSVALRLSTARIRSAILKPETAARDGFRAVKVRTKAGEEITGVLKNEDNFSLQILRGDGEYALLERNEVAAITRVPLSLMPDDYGRRLGPAELQNLLAFLDRLRAPFLTFDVTFQNY